MAGTGEGVTGSGVVVGGTVVTGWSGSPCAVLLYHRMLRERWWLAAAALAVVVLDRAPQGGEHIKQLLVGSILTVSARDVAVLAPRMYAQSE